jgi:hypothetical protein
MCDRESLVTYEGTAEIQSLLVGRDITAGHSCDPPAPDSAGRWFDPTAESGAEHLK